MTEHRWRDQAACRDHPISLWFPDLTGPNNHGAEAKAICATCPVREPCLSEAIARNEGVGILGGAGQLNRRTLRRAYQQDGPTGPVWRLALARHFARLDGGHQGPVNGNGAHATCGLASTYAKGDRCPACTLAAAIRGAADKVTKPDVRSRKRVA